MIPNVSIIILNWNGWKDTIECLNSLYQLDYPKYNIILIDNDSQDESIKKIKKYIKKVHKSPQKHPLNFLELSEDEIESLNTESEFFCSNLNKKMILIKNKLNHGFTKGNNIGIDYALRYLNPDYVLLLNNDTIVKKSFLSELVKIGEKYSDVGFVGPKIYFYEHEKNENIVQYAGGNQNLWRFEPFPIGYGMKDKGQFNKNKKVGFISGACMLVKTDMIKKIGTLDETFFSYREENEWCMRGYKSGWTTFYAYKSVIWHKGQGSTKNKKLDSLILYYMTRNKFLFVKKYANNKELTEFIFYFFLFDFWYRIVVSIFYHKNMKLVRCYLKAVKYGLKHLKN